MGIFQIHVGVLGYYHVSSSDIAFTEGLKDTDHLCRLPGREVYHRIRDDRGWIDEALDVHGNRRAYMILCKQIFLNCKD